MDPETNPDEEMSEDLQAAADYKAEVHPWVVKTHAIMDVLTRRFDENRKPFLLNIILRGITYEVLIGPATHGFFTDLTKTSNRETFLPARASLLWTPAQLLRVTSDSRYVNGERGDQPLQPYFSAPSEVTPILRDLRRWTDPLIDELHKQLVTG